MEITMRDGRVNTLLDVITLKQRMIELAEHAMRFHVYDPSGRTARVQFHTDRETAMRVVYIARAMYGGKPYTTCPWIHIKNRVVEFWDASKYRKLLERDLQSWWGDSAVITGTSIRDVYYVSDGSMETTPNAIGKAFNRPLLYKGRIVASIFKLGKHDVLHPGDCVVYWLPRAWWNGFHSRYRAKPKDFPGLTGFGFTNWCQRWGNTGYREGIYLADMSQIQSVGQWSFSNLVSYWHARGTDLMSLVGSQTIRVDMGKERQPDSGGAIMWRGAAAGTPLGMIGTRCLTCGRGLEYGVSYCKSCVTNNINYFSYGAILSCCTLCGMRVSGYHVTSCMCGQKGSAVKVSHEGYMKQVKNIEGIYKTIIGGG